MKKYLFILLAAMAFVACSDDGPNMDELNLKITSRICDPKYLGRNYCYAMDESDFWLFKECPAYYRPIPHGEKEYHMRFDSIERVLPHDVLNYKNLRFVIYQGYAEGSYYSREYSKEESKAQNAYYYFRREAEERMTLGPTRVVTYITAFHTGNIKITADKPLFGQPAGTDLSEHFVVECPNGCLPQGSIQDFHFVFWYDDGPQVMKAREFYAKDTWLQQVQAIWFGDIPEEHHDIVRFTFQLPVRCEYWWKYFLESLKDVPVEERILTYRCTVDFTKKSDFKEMFDLYDADNPHLKWK